MRKHILFCFFIVLSVLALTQPFDFYGPQPFGEILENSFNKTWSPSAVSGIENRSYVVLLDESKSNAIQLDGTNIYTINAVSMEDLTGANATYGSWLRGIFQIVDINTHEDNGEVALEGKYRVSPFLHSYFSLNASLNNTAINSDAGSMQISESERQGYVLVEFEGDASAAKLKATSQFEYDASSATFAEVTGWTTHWLKTEGNNVSWTSTESDASTFFLADPSALMDLLIEDGSEFNPTEISYQPNATAAIPEDVNLIEDSRILTDVEQKVNDESLEQLGTSTTAATAAAAMLDQIENTLAAAGSTLRYPKEFYLALRENMLSHKIASTDIYGARIGYNTVPHVYFTNASDDDGTPHPFMVVASHAVSTRPNQLVDVNRPPGAEQGVGYAETSVTRHGKLGEFLTKFPLKDYGLIDDLLDNDLSEIGDLASDFDTKQGTTTTKTVYNYAALASSGVAVDGVTIYPASNNNLRFAVEDAEVTHSGIHVGGGLELHYHADGHAFSGNGINLYNLSDYEGHDHPPVIGFAYDGIALFGRYESDYPSMVGNAIALDEFGGHDHNDGFGYHYHAHTQAVTTDQGVNFNEHFLHVGAWRGDINEIPGFNEGKTNQLDDESIARYVGVGDSGTPTDPGTVLSVDNPAAATIVYPNPTRGSLKVKASGLTQVAIYDLEGRLVALKQSIAPDEVVEFRGLPRGLFILKATSGSSAFTQKIVID